MASWSESNPNIESWISRYFTNPAAARESLNEAVATWGEPSVIGLEKDAAGTSKVPSKQKNNNTLPFMHFTTPEGLVVVFSFPPGYPETDSVECSLIAPTLSTDGAGGRNEEAWWNLPKLYEEIEMTKFAFAGGDQLVPVLNVCLLAGHRLGSIVYEDGIPSGMVSPEMEIPPIDSVAVPVTSNAEQKEVQVSSTSSILQNDSNNGSRAVEAAGSPAVAVFTPGKVYEMVYDCWALVFYFLHPREICTMTLVNSFLAYVASDETVWREKFLSSSPRSEWSGYSFMADVHKHNKAERKKALVPYFSWSYRWSWVVQRFEYKANYTETEAAEHRTAGAKVAAWKWLFTNTSNPFAKEWSRIMANFYSGNADVALRYFQKFPFDKISSKLAGLLNIPVSDSDQLRLRSQISDKSLDNEEGSEFDVTTILGVRLKYRDVRCNSIREVLGDPDIEPSNNEKQSKISVLFQEVKQLNKAGTVTSQHEINAKSATSAVDIWAEANDAPVLITRREVTLFSQSQKPGDITVMPKKGAPNVQEHRTVVSSRAAQLARLNAVRNAAAAAKQDS